MSFDEFFSSLKEATGKDYQRSDVEELFNEMDISCDGRVGWQTFLTLMFQHYNHIIDAMQAFENVPISQPLIRHCTYNKREPITRVLALSQSPPMHYISVGKRGTLVVWNSDLNNMKPLEMNVGRFNKRQKSIPKFQEWTTDAVYMGNVHKMAVSTLSRGIHFFDVTTTFGSEQVHLFGLSHTATALCYWYDTEGVKSCDFSFSLSLLVTAGVGPVVRVWNRYVTSSPTAVLHSHQTSVVDVVIHEALGKIFSYSKDAVLEIWDIPSQQCEKTFQVKFPNIQTGVTPEQGSFPLLLNLTADPVLLVTCRDYLAEFRLKESNKTKTNNRSGPYTCALYNPHLEQVITACADSTITVWDVKTGTKRMEVRNAHGKEEVSCMALDVHQRRLISAATNGTIKVWNLLNGHNLHKLETVSNTVVTGIICHRDDMLLATGWSRQITQYSIAFSKVRACLCLNHTLFNGYLKAKTAFSQNKPIMCIVSGYGFHYLKLAVCLCETSVKTKWVLMVGIYVPSHLPWMSDQQHREDILAMDQCLGLGLLATGSSDGEIIIWTLAVQKPNTRLRRSQEGKVHLPIHRLLFLQKRAEQSHLRNSAVLLSSQAGSVCWWSIYGSRHNHGKHDNRDQLMTGQFYVPDECDESVMGLSTDQENSLLVTGDTTGSIKVWDISHYALSAGDMESAKELPPLLHYWRGHERAIVSCEVLVYESQLFVLSASVDRRACLWTREGGCVGCFGQEQQWDLSNPDTYQSNRERTSPIKKEKEDSQSRASSGESSGESDHPQKELATNLQTGCTALQTPDFERTPDQRSSWYPLSKYNKNLSGEDLLEDLKKKMAAQRRRRQIIDGSFGEEFTGDQEIPEIHELEESLKTWELKMRQTSSRGTEVSSQIFSSEDVETLED
ncbi:WD repeat-containing protein on Y chromosome [Pimephales promelas]|uniref:WD repeat-containing protein on Y chromosome n=1 Tax=Pimephales promelas TaxID=90988 RepID=UPI0019555B46|nr:WD repeat-containing protein on Y chromosome [Pimephales promelas]